MRENGRPVNRVEYRVVGMSRSGNHAIINWILGQTRGRYCFLNCAEPKHNPYLTARPLQSGQTYRVNYTPFDLQAEQAGHFSKKDYLLYSYEDVFLGMLDAPQFEQNHDRFVGPSAVRFDILILRDPFNLFASRIKSGLYDGPHRPGKIATLKAALRIWKQHAHTYLGRRAYLSNGPVGILFNRWVSSRRYREKIARQLGLAFTDRNYSRVAGVAGGSSFDGLRYATRAHNMPVLERWKHFQENPRYWAAFDDEMFALSEEIFGFVPGVTQTVAGLAFQPA